ncbi:MAG TPA: ABC transporter substrate-binding protein [Pirellulales bacterium]|nr:ABC transporter substrate-binding protein [Pirellulales bacterium]
MKIVSLLPGGTEILCALGLRESLVGVSHECDFPPSVSHLPRLTRSRLAADQSSLAIDEQVRAQLQSGESLYELDAARLYALAPDLIVTQAQCEVCAVRFADVERLVQHAPELRQTQIFSLQPASLGEMFSDLNRLAEVVQRRAAARAFLEQAQARLAAVGAALANVLARPLPKVACIEWLDPLMLAGHWTPELIALAGGTSGLTKAGAPSPYVRWSALAEFDPDTIVVAPCGFDLTRTRQEMSNLARNAFWRQLRAVVRGEVYLLDGNAYLNRCGPRLIDTVELLAALVHPEEAASFAAPRSAGYERWQPGWE